MELNFTTDWDRAWSASPSSRYGKFRCQNEDFRVDEELGFEPAGEGEHVYIQFEKIGQNTQWVIETLALELNISKPLFGRSGIKDRHAVTTQWVSVQQPGTTPDFNGIEIPGVRFLQIGRHPKKLRPGTHAQNNFCIVLRDLSAEPEQLDQVLSTIAEKGFPNYFGAQRFGIDGQNLMQGWKLLSSRRLGRHKKKGFYLSALRSYVFNQVLSKRIEAGRFASTDELDDSGPLWGRGTPPISDVQADYEKHLLAQWAPLLTALEFAGLSQERRPLVTIPKNLSWRWLESSTLELKFSLPAGSYATSLIRELGDMEDMARQTLMRVK